MNDLRKEIKTKDEEIEYLRKLADGDGISEDDFGERANKFIDKLKK
jgi:hypothetical protein